MDLSAFAEHIGFLNPVKQCKLEALAEIPVGKWRRHRGGEATPNIGITQTVKSIEVTDEFVEMFDVVNSETARFSADGFVVHNSAAAMMKVAMLNCYQALERPFGKRISTRYGRIVTLWNSPNDIAHEVRLVMQVHDEMVWEVRKKIAQPFAEWVKNQMETAITGFRCPIVAETGIGPDLETAKGG
jgi:hypothetical protein